MTSGQKSITYASLSIVIAYIGFVTVFFKRFFLIITIILSIAAIIHGVRTIYGLSKETNQKKLSLILANFGIIIGIAMLISGIYLFYVLSKILNSVHGF